MLRTTDTREVRHFNPTPAHSVQVPSRRQVLAAFERILDRLEDVEDGAAYADLGQDIQTLQVYLATR